MVRVLFPWKVVKKALKKRKNDVLHECLRHMGISHGKKIIFMVYDIDGDISKICFCKSYISSKIIYNPSKKFILEVIKKWDGIHINFWESSSDISLKRNCYIWMAINQVTKQVWTQFWPNKKKLL